MGCRLQVRGDTQEQRAALVTGGRVQNRGGRWVVGALGDVWRLSVFSVTWKSWSLVESEDSGGGSV